MNIDPFQLFTKWYAEELEKSTNSLPAACCISTIGLDEYPNARFVSLKELKNDAFIITGPLQSRKGMEIEKSPKIAITFWWETTQRQIRIQGNASKISNSEAISYFKPRAKDSKIISTISEQGNIVESIDTFKQKFYEAESIYKNNDVVKPENWGGYAIQPIRIEFMEFKTNRFHHRTLFQLNNKEWTTTILQP
ncbi:pyridoxamine 5'-phosphate oxidase [Aquimarina sp. AD1]|uniref:pyridoxine/pyridoxamine 5'-phosphate oxidase n=1 Tax=Aquimarina TaxID=290174 RepID=UPI00041E4597|nr:MULTISPECIES: pyridoxal 5'-phosphate synthase [Aquimarina]AXT58530.1 pyridoxamine 5'-phosphate oxidase [Aquimarina sp. AD1]RKN31544.1 pyridoxamine 5'-phosphate oxidase [Aquimarina sp. AD1]